jgi:hypothetical protein
VKLAVLVALLFTANGAAAQVIELERCDSLYFELEYETALDCLLSDDITPRRNMFLAEDLLARTQRSYPNIDSLWGLTIDIGGRLSYSQNTARAVVATSLGKFVLARESVRRAVVDRSDSIHGLSARAMLNLYTGDLDSASHDIELMESLGCDVARWYMLFRIAEEIYTAQRDLGRLAHLYSRRGAYYQSMEDPAPAGIKNADARFFEAMEDRTLYSSETSSDRVALPLVEYPVGSGKLCLPLVVDGNEYRVLIDTGNEAGWTVHNSRLRRHMTSIRGANVQAASGATNRTHSGFRILTDTLQFGDWKINNLLGVYFSKPTEGSYDAMLNPYWIRDRVVTIDFSHDSLIVSTHEEFDRALASIPDDRISSLRVYGYRVPFVHVEVNGVDTALAMIETGAQDIWVNDRYADWIKLPVTKSTQVDSKGISHQLVRTGVTILMGNITINRNAALVLPSKFRDEITGVHDQIMIGPKALRGRGRVAIDAGNRRIVLINDE